MALFLFALLCLLVLAIFYLIAQRRPSVPFVWITSLTTTLYRDNKGFMIGLAGVICLHLAGTVLLGGVRYNTSGFTIITHTMFGFVTRELIVRIDRARPFIGKIRNKFPRKAQKYVNASTLAFAICGANAVQEEIWEYFHPGMWPTTMIHVLDQVSDVIFDTVGIIISIHKERFQRMFSKIFNKTPVTGTEYSIKDSQDLK